MIRSVCRDDIEAIVNIYNHYVSCSVATFETEPLSRDEMWSRIEAISSSYPCLVYEDAGVVIGYCYAHQWKEKAAYSLTAETTVYVSPDRQGEGIGSALMERLMEECEAMGLHALIACVTSGNHGSVALHERLGFKQVSRFEQVGMKFGEWLGVVDYEFIINHNEL